MNFDEIVEEVTELDSEDENKDNRNSGKSLSIECLCWWLMEFKPCSHTHGVQILHVVKTAMCNVVCGIVEAIYLYIFIIILYYLELVIG